MDHRVSDELNTISDDASAAAYPVPGRRCACEQCGQVFTNADRHLGKRRRFCSRACNGAYHASRWHELHPPRPARPRAHCRNCGEHLSKYYRGPTFLCLICGPRARAIRTGAVSHKRTNLTRGLASILRDGSKLERKTRLPKPIIFRMCCLSWTIRGTTHPHMTQRAYMRAYYHRSTAWQLAYMLGIRRKEEQAELPKAFYDTAYARRQLIVALKHRRHREATENPG